MSTPDEPEFPRNLPPEMREILERLRERGARTPTLVDTCAESGQPVYGLVGEPLGLKPQGMSYSIDSKGRPVRIDLTYSNGRASVHVKSGRAEERGQVMFGRLGGDTAPTPEEASESRPWPDVRDEATGVALQHLFEIARSVEPGEHAAGGNRAQVWRIPMGTLLLAELTVSGGSCVVATMEMSEADFDLVLKSVRRIDDDAEELAKQSEQIRGGLIVRDL